MTKTELPILVLTTIYQVWLYVYSVVLGKMVNGQAGSRACEESDMQAIDVKGTVIGPLRLSMELLAWPLSCYRQIPNWRK